MQRKKQTGRKGRDTGKPCICRFPFRRALGHHQYSGDLQIIGEMCISLEGSFKLCWLDFHHSFHYSLGQKQSNKGSCLLSADFESLSPVSLSLLSVFMPAAAGISSVAPCLSQGSAEFKAAVSRATSLAPTCFLDWAPCSFTAWLPSLFKIALLGYNS